MCNCDNSEKVMELRALIDHMKHHTEHHTEEIVKLAETAGELGFAESKAALEECKALSDKLVESFLKALETM